MAIFVKIIKRGAKGRKEHAATDNHDHDIDAPMTQRAKESPVLAQMVIGMWGIRTMRLTNRRFSHEF